MAVPPSVVSRRGFWIECIAQKHIRLDRRKACLTGLENCEFQKAMTYSKYKEKYFYSFLTYFLFHSFFSIFYSPHCHFFFYLLFLIFLLSLSSSMNIFIILSTVLYLTFLSPSYLPTSNFSNFSICIISLSVPYIPALLGFINLQLILCYYCCICFIISVVRIIEHCRYFLYVDIWFIWKFIL